MGQPVLLGCWSRGAIVTRVAISEYHQWRRYNVPWSGHKNRVEALLTRVECLERNTRASRWTIGRYQCRCQYMALSLLWWEVICLEPFHIANRDVRCVEGPIHSPLERNMLRSSYYVDIFPIHETGWIAILWKERRTLSTLGRFFPYHVCSTYGLHGPDWDRVFFRIPHSHKNLEVPQGFRFEEVFIFTYSSRQLIDDRGTSLWVVAYTEDVVRVCTVPLLSAYDQCFMWYVPPQVNSFSP